MLCNTLGPTGCSVNIYLCVAQITSASFERTAHGHTASWRWTHGGRYIIPGALCARTLMTRIRCRVCVGLLEAHTVARAHVAVVAARMIIHPSALFTTNHSRPHVPESEHLRSPIGLTRARNSTANSDAFKPGPIHT